ncbi:response regulator [Muricoccus vinaceus]|uniref:Response regulator n=1 Tax=Muricoccus vinaceus TaxID=424704 RepID=A0ABV6ISP7_9PROT
MSRDRRLLGLVADDHEMFRAAFAELLRKEFDFFLVAEAGSLEQTLEELHANPAIGLAFIDLTMPGMNGLVSLEAIRAAHPGVQVVVVSGSERREDILMALNAGVHGYIPKALGIKAIAMAVATVLGGNIFVPTALTIRPALPVPAPILAAAPPTGVAIAAQMAGGVKLSARQREVITLLAQGKSNKEIARDLKLSEGTVKVHLNALFRALGAHNRVGAVAAMDRVFARERRVEA